jgi:acyl-coenzyme A synthetase/AMP-(fatty) acid ligase
MLVQHPDVLEAGVVSVADSHWGERPKAFVTVKEGREMKGEELIEWAKHESSIRYVLLLLTPRAESGASGN